MPCNSEYMNPSQAEQNSKEVCGLLIYLSNKVGKTVPSWVGAAASNTYGNPRRLDEATQMLCALCQESGDEVIYNDIRDPMCRRLADWWEEHKAADRARIDAENEEKARKLHELALQSRKYSDDELASVGLKRIHEE